MNEKRRKKKDKDNNIMSRKREKPYHYHSAYSTANHVSSKRRRPNFLPPEDQQQPENHSPKLPATVVVIGLSPNCSVLDLKSRFEIYGSISRTRMDTDGVAHITFRSSHSADAAIAASVDSSFGISLCSKPVQVMRETDPVPQWREGIRNKNNSSSSSKLLRGELPLSRQGRGNKIWSAIVNPRDNIKNDTINNSSAAEVQVPFKGREIVAYDDIL